MRKVRQKQNDEHREKKTNIRDRDTERERQ